MCCVRCAPAAPPRLPRPLAASPNAFTLPLPPPEATPPHSPLTRHLTHTPTHTPSPPPLALSYGGESYYTCDRLTLCPIQKKMIDQEVGGGRGGGAGRAGAREGQKMRAGRRAAGLGRERREERARGKGGQRWSRAK